MYGKGNGGKLKTLEIFWVCLTPRHRSVGSFAHDCSITARVGEMDTMGCVIGPLDFKNKIYRVI